MNLATPAPQVEKAEAEPAPREDSTNRTDAATLVEPAVAMGPAPRVDAARPYDDARQHAPPSVMNATTISLQEAQQSLSVQALRANVTNNTRGKLDFEAYAAVIQGPAQKNVARRWLPCIFDERDFVAYGLVKYFVAVWGQSCFVYAEETSLKPYFAVDLALYDASQEDPDKPDPNSHTISPAPGTNKPRPTMITILLKSKSRPHSLAYQFTFDTENDPTLAKRFLDIVQRIGDKNTEIVVEGVVEEVGSKKLEK